MEPFKNTESLTCRYFCKNLLCTGGSDCPLPHVLEKDRRPERISRKFLENECYFDNCRNYARPKIRSDCSQNAMPIDNQTYVVNDHISNCVANIAKDGNLQQYPPTARNILARSNIFNELSSMRNSGYRRIPSFENFLDVSSKMKNQLEFMMDFYKANKDMHDQIFAQRYRYKINELTSLETVIVVGKTSTDKRQIPQDKNLEYTSNAAENRGEMEPSLRFVSEDSEHFSKSPTSYFESVDSSCMHQQEIRDNERPCKMNALQCTSQYPFKFDDKYESFPLKFFSGGNSEADIFSKESDEDGACTSVKDDESDDCLTDKLSIPESSNTVDVFRYMAKSTFKFDDKYESFFLKMFSRVNSKAGIFSKESDEDGACSSVKDDESGDCWTDTLSIPESSDTFLENFTFDSPVMTPVSPALQLGNQNQERHLASQSVAREQPRKFRFGHRKLAKGKTNGEFGNPDHYYQFLTPPFFRKYTKVFRFGHQNFPEDTAAADIGNSNHQPHSATQSFSDAFPPNLKFDVPSLPQRNVTPERVRRPILISKPFPMDECRFKNCYKYVHSKIWNDCNQNAIPIVSETNVDNDHISNCVANIAKDGNLQQYPSIAHNILARRNISNEHSSTRNSGSRRIPPSLHDFLEVCLKLKIQLELMMNFCRTVKDLHDQIFSHRNRYKVHETDVADEETSFDERQIPQNENLENTSNVAENRGNMELNHGFISENLEHFCKSPTSSESEDSSCEHQEEIKSKKRARKMNVLESSSESSSENEDYYISSARNLLSRMNLEAEVFSKEPIEDDDCSSNEGNECSLDEDEDCSSDEDEDCSSDEDDDSSSDEDDGCSSDDDDDGSSDEDDLPDMLSIPESYTFMQNFRFDSPVMPPVNTALHFGIQNQERHLAIQSVDSEQSRMFTFGDTKLPEGQTIGDFDNPNNHCQLSTPPFFRKYTTVFRFGDQNFPEGTAAVDIGNPNHQRHSATESPSDACPRNLGFDDQNVPQRNVIPIRKKLPDPNCRKFSKYEFYFNNYFSYVHKKFRSDCNQNATPIDSETNVDNDHISNCVANIAKDGHLQHYPPITRNILARSNISIELSSPNKSGCRRVPSIQKFVEICFKLKNQLELMMNFCKAVKDLHDQISTHRYRYKVHETLAAFEKAFFDKRQIHQSENLEIFSNATEKRGNMAQYLGFISENSEPFCKSPTPCSESVDSICVYEPEIKDNERACNMNVHMSQPTFQFDDEYESFLLKLLSRENLEADIFSKESDEDDELYDSLPDTLSIPESSMFMKNFTYDSPVRTPVHIALQFDYQNQERHFSPQSFARKQPRVFRFGHRKLSKGNGNGDGCNQDQNRRVLSPPFFRKYTTVFRFGHQNFPEGTAAAGIGNPNHQRHSAT